MRKFLYILIFAANAFLLVAQQQSPKPIYQIESKREGTSIGIITVELFPLAAPLHVAYFDSLVAIKFYDSLAFHRVVPAFVIQGGDPNSKHLPRDTWGNGDPNQKNIPAEFNNIAYARGVLGAARDTDPNSANSQFFICIANAFSLNAQYTAYGRVLTGINIVDTIVAAPRDANDNPLKKIEMFITKIGVDSSKPTIPSQINPVNNANRITTDSNLIWSSVAGAVLYRLEIASDSNFSTIVFSNDVGGTTYRLSSVQLGLKKYYWRVSSNNGGYRSEFSSTRSFTTAIAVPALHYPLNAAVDMPGNVTLKWSSISGAVSYHVQVATNAIFNQTGMVFDQKGITDTVKQMSGLQLVKKHYWRVAAETPEYEGAFSPQWNFFTGTSTNVIAENNMPTEFSLHQNFPNPFNPSTKIHFSIPSSHSVTTTSLKIFDLLGREVATLIDKPTSAGIYTVEWNAEGFPGGVYFYRLQSGNYSETKRLILLK